MNERIEKLALQAEEYALSVCNNNGHFHRIYREKFALLIVAECIDVFSKDLPDPTSADYQPGSLPEVVNRVANVAEHFGVES